MDFNTLRQKYAGYSDDEILGALKATKYPDFSVQEIAQAVGYKPKPAGFLRSVADLGIEAASGVARGVKATADAFGADNAVSRGADTVDKFAREYLSAAAKADDQRVSEIMAAAQDAGVWEQVKAAAEAFTVKPAGMVLNAFGTSVPTIAAAMIPGVGQAGVAARLGALGAMGAAQGAGAVKGSIYEAVKAEQIKAGASESEAEAAAVRAQEYGGENTANIAGGAALGAAASATGVQPVIAKLLQRGEQVAAEVGKRGILDRALNPEGLIARTGMGALKEAPLEAAQGGQEQYASNIALQNEGFDTPAFRGVAGSAALEGLASAGPGAAFAALDKPATRAAAEPKPDPVAAVLAAPDVDTAIKAAAEGLTGAKKPAPAELPQMDAEDRREVLGLMQVVNRPGVSPNVARFAQARMDALLAPYRSIPTGEATEMLPVADARELSDEERAEYANAAPFSYRRAMERGLPQPEVTEVLPTGDATEVEPIPAGDAFEAIPAPEAYETLPTGEASDLIPTADATEFEAVPAGDAAELDVETIQPTDLMAKDGEPFTSKTGAQAKAYASGGGKVVAIPNHFGSGIPGYVVRPLMPAQPNNTRGTNADDVARPDGQRPADAGRGQRAGVLPDSGPGDVLPSPEGAAGQGVAGPGAAGGGTARPDALTTPADTAPSIERNAFGMPVGYRPGRAEKTTAGDLKEGDWINEGKDILRVRGVKALPDGRVELDLDGLLSRQTATVPGARQVTRRTMEPTGPAAAPAPAPTEAPTFTEGQRVQLAGQSYTVTTVNGSAVKLQGADGAVKMVARNSKTFGQIQREPNEAARPQAQAAAGESAAPAAAPAPAAPAVVPGAGPATNEAGRLTVPVRTFGSSGYQLTMAQALAKVKELEADARRRKTASTKAPTAIMRGIEEDAASRAATLARKLREDIKQAVNSYPDARAEYAEARGEAQPASVAVEADGVDDSTDPFTLDKRTLNARIDRLVSAGEAADSISGFMELRKRYMKATGKPSIPPAGSRFVAMYPDGAAVEADGVDKFYAGLIGKKSTTQISSSGGRTLYEVQVTPEMRNKHHVNGRFPETAGFALKPKGDVTGNPGDSGYVLIDKREQARQRATPNAEAPVQAAPRGAEAAPVAPAPAERTPKAQAVKEALAGDRQPFEHAGLKVYPTKMRRDGAVVDVWAVQLPENKGTDKVLGDTLHTTIDEAKKSAEYEAKRDNDRKEWARKEEADRADSEAKKEANRGKNITERAADFTLNQPNKLPPSAGLGTGTRREAMDKAVEQGRAIRAETVEDTAAKNRDKKAVEAVSKAGYLLGLSNENIPVVKAGLEARARLKADKYPKIEYRVYGGRLAEGPFHTITKIEYDYAVQRQAEQFAAEQDRPTPAPMDAATHKDPGEPAEPVTPAVVREAIKTGVQATDRKPSAMKADLLQQIDDAVKEAPDYPDFEALVKQRGDKEAREFFTMRAGVGEKAAPEGYSRPKRTFRVEGDGVFTVNNTVRQLLTFRASVESSPGFKDRQAPAGLTEKATTALDRRSTDAAIANMVDEGDFQAALDFAEAKGVDIGAVKLTKLLRDRLEKWQKDQASAKAVADYEAARAEGKPAPGSLAAAFAEKEAEPAPAEAPATADEKAPQLSEDKARQQFEWRNLGQKNGTKTHALFFYFKPEDRGTGRAMRYGSVQQLQGDSDWRVNDAGIGYRNLAPAKFNAELDAIEALKTQGFIKPNPAAAPAPTPAAQEPAGRDEQPEAQALTLEAIPKSLQITLEVEDEGGKVQKKVVGARRAYLAAQQRVQKLQALKECVG